MHCCVCQGICMHVGGPYYCAAHDPSRLARIGWLCPKCGAGVAPHVDKCPCSGVVALPFPVPCEPWIPDDTGTITSAGDPKYRIFTSSGTSPNVRFDVTGYSEPQ